MWEVILRKAPTDKEIYLLINKLEAEISKKTYYTRFTSPPKGKDLNTFEGRIWMIRNSVNNQDSEDWMKHLNRIRDFAHLTELLAEEMTTINYLIDEIWKKFKFREDNA